MKKTPKCFFSISHFSRSFGAIWRDSRHGCEQWPILGEFVRLSNNRTGVSRVVDNLDEHGWYSKWGSGRNGFLSRFSPIESLDLAIKSATHWSNGRFGTLSPNKLNR